MTEHRRHERIRPQQQIDIFDLHTEEHYGVLADISAGGLLLIGPQALPTNRIYQLRLEFAEPILGPRRIELGVDTLWHRPNTDNTRFWTGCCLICIAPEAEAVLGELIQEQPETGRNLDPT